MSAAAIRGVVRQLGPAADPPSDADLLTAYVLRKDTDAFAALVARHGPTVFGVCRRVLGDAHDAEDAFQAVFLVLVKKAAGVRPPGSLGGWLHGVAELLATLPDLPFDYTLELTLDSKIPPGTLKPLVRLRNLHSIRIVAKVPITSQIAELAAVTNLQEINLLGIPSANENLLTDELAKELLSLPSLQSVVGSGPITDRGVKDLASHPTLMTHRSLINEGGFGNRAYS